MERGSRRCARDSLAQAQSPPRRWQLRQAPRRFSSVPTLASSQSPALVDVALCPHLADLNRNAVGPIGRGGNMGGRLHRHLLLIRAVGEGLDDRASIETGQGGVMVV